jgi:catechol 2,3-dioxygenase-like lactoylglutathione lyase family enzyme
MMLTTPRTSFIILVLAASVVGWSASPLRVDGLSQDPGHIPTLIRTCVISNNVKRLVDFYEPVLNLKAKWSGKDYVEFPTGAGILAIFSADAQQSYIPGSSEAASNKSMVLEFELADVDMEYRRLGKLVKTWVKAPTTQPWGTRSIYFRDPDGNLVDFYTSPKAQ